jgi:hypothetical protein
MRAVLDSKARTAALKKDRERWALHRFLALRKEPVPQIIQANEEPDFVLTFGLRRVGIEMTDLYWNQTRAGPAPRQEQESLRRRVVRLAERLYADRFLPPVHVSVRFNDQFELDKAAITPLATRMADWAASRLPQTGASFAEEYDWLNRVYFPQELHALRIYRYDWTTRPRFSAPDADYVPDLAIADVRRALDSKNPRHDAYLRKCTEVWHVINVNADRLSTTLEVGDSITSVTYESPFGRVFFLQHMTSHLSELNRPHGFRQDA